MCSLHPVGNRDGGSVSILVPYPSTWQTFPSFKESINKYIPFYTITYEAYIMFFIGILHPSPTKY